MNDLIAEFIMEQQILDTLPECPTGRCNCPGCDYCKEARCDYPYIGASYEPIQPEKEVN